MFKRLKSLLDKGPTSLKVSESGSKASKELQIATGVILLEMAGRDDDFAPEEVKSIFREMKDQFSMSDSEVMEALEESQQLLGDQETLGELVKIINTNFNKEQREIILNMAVAVLNADGEVERAEERFLEQLKNRLKLTQ